MGKAIEQMLPLMKTRHELVPFLFIGNETSPLFAMSATDLGGIEDEILKTVDVWVDFTSDRGLHELLKLTEKYKTPVVSGSTGLTEKNFTQLKTAAKKRKIFWSSNMSPGLWAFRQAMRGLESISQFDFAIEETHHTQKKDRPSGTAKTLHSDLEKITSKKIPTPTSFRLGGVFGVHTIYSASSNEVITMQHQALNRTVFAEGALLACDWIIAKKSGFYSMDDMFLKIKNKA